jgi:hypothetical protein
LKTISKPDMHKIKQTKRAPSLRQAVTEAMERRVLMSTYTVNTLSDAINPVAGQLTLRQAVADANADTTPDTISFDPAVFTPASLHTITLENGPILFTNTTAAINLNGPGSAVVAVDGNQVSRVFEIAPGAAVSISGLTVTHGEANASAGSVATGGGIQSAGSLALSNVSILNNTITGLDGASMTDETGGSTDGAGIFSSGSLLMQDSVVSGNSETGGGPYSYTVPFGTGSDTVTTGSGGYANGAGIYSSGPLTITNSTVSGHTAARADPCQSPSQPYLITAQRAVNLARLRAVLRREVESTPLELCPSSDQP